ncbi:methyltransferase domain-containing protein [Streptomyces sp. TR1341]|uniref:methyltransferase domain-containing protein n=1 Tax=Streptomyces sp. TR1341 TaxID=2601266 RepID=UPI00138B1B74|nr:methyltransferase domain-containing protein [Streptomyces sp. TR1341]
MLTDDDWGFANSTGLGFTHPVIVDAHFQACEASYLRLLRRVGIEMGWRVLDAGCGSGEFLPALAALVGPAGRVHGIDLAAENAELAGRRLPAHPALRAADVRQGDLLDLPYPDDSFDAMWCANTVQYLDDRSLYRALAEARRVVRPGGIVAVKDLDGHRVTARPAASGLFEAFFRTAARHSGYVSRLLRTADLDHYLRQAGLLQVRRETVLIEHFAPLAEPAQRFYKAACARLAAQARTLGVGDGWEPFLDPGAVDHPLDRPEGYIAEGNVLAVGVVPPDSREHR